MCWDEKQNSTKVYLITAGSKHACSLRDSRHTRAGEKAGEDGRLQVGVSAMVWPGLGVWSVLRETSTLAHCLHQKKGGALLEGSQLGVKTQRSLPELWRSPASSAWLYKEPSPSQGKAASWDREGQRHIRVKSNLESRKQTSLKLMPLL